MRICASCGCANKDGAEVCFSCGKGFNFERNEGPVFYTADINKRSDLGIAFSKGGDFVSADEYIVATLKNGVADNLFSGEGVKAEDAVLSNKRLYYKRKTGIINVSVREVIIDVDDITGSKIQLFYPVGMLILSVAVFVIGFLCSVVSKMLFLFIPFSVLAAFFSIMYLFWKKAFLKIEYAGGEILFSVRKYGLEQIREFQKCIYAVKDHLGNKKK